MAQSCLYYWHISVQRGNYSEDNKIPFLCSLDVHSIILSVGPDIFGWPKLRP